MLQSLIQIAIGFYNSLQYLREISAQMRQKFSKQIQLKCHLPILRTGLHLKVNGCFKKKKNTI